MWRAWGRCAQGSSGETQGKEPLGRPRRRWEDNIKMDLQEVGGVKKGKSVPLQAWSGPEGSRKLRFPDLITTAQGDGKVVSHTHWPNLPPGNPPGTHFC